MNGFLTTKLSQTNYNRIKQNNYIKIKECSDKKMLKLTPVK